MSNAQGPGGVISPPDAATITASATALGVMAQFDTFGYQSFLVVPNGGSGSIANVNQLAIEGTNTPLDSTSWQGCTGFAQLSPGQIVTTNVLATACAFGCMYRYYRVRMSNYVSGTTVITVILRQTYVPLSSAVVIGASAGASAGLPSAIATNDSVGLKAKNAAGNLYKCSGAMNAAGYVWIFDRSTAPANGNGNVGLIWCEGQFTASSPFSISWLPGPALTFTTNCWIVASSTPPPTLTLTSAFSIQALVR
ncbi:MAG TPA: hypothetical protein VG651_04540 [Stellaceae bacterium]|nr:hypothetical protein [Stellaceae bacterium]